LNKALSNTHLQKSNDTINLSEGTS